MPTKREQCLASASTVRALCTMAMALVAGCADPSCPAGYRKEGDVCRRADAASDLEEAGTEPVSAGDAAAADANDSEADARPAPGAEAGTGEGATQVISCEDLDCDENARCVADGDRSRACECKEGYVGSGTSCHSIDCGTPRLDNGKAKLTSGSTSYESGVSYECNPGYNRSGPATGSCGTDGKWGPTPTCNAVDCGSPQLPKTKSGTVNGKVVLSGGTGYGATATYACNSGFSISGSERRTCQVDGTWSGRVPSCEGCGDGYVTAGEQCDPEATGYNAWTCSQDCKKTTLYTQCKDLNNSTECGSGEFCGIFDGACARSCSTAADCGPTGNSNSRPLCIGVAASSPQAPGWCGVSCKTRADCPPNLGCWGGNYCADCAVAAGWNETFGSDTPCK